MYFSVQYYNYLLRSVGPINKVEYEEKLKCNQVNKRCDI